MKSNTKRSMTTRYKNELYNHFFKDTPIPYKSITSKQWEELANTTTGRVIFNQLQMEKTYEELNRALDKNFKVTPAILGLSKKVSWLERKISTYRFKRRINKL